MIELNPIDSRVYDYFVEQLNQRDINHYNMPDLGYKQLSQELETKFSQVQKLLKDKFKYSILEFELDPSKQENLNSLHQRWVKLHKEFPYIKKIFDTKIPGALDRINVLIHSIEGLTHMIDAKSSNANEMIPNHFGTNILKNGIFNLSVAFQNLGRTSYNKWENGDTNQDFDLNNFSELSTTLRLRVVPSFQQTLPEQYQKWCNTHNIPCVGKEMPLANFNKLDDNLSRYRQLFYKNSLIENNFFTLE